MAGLMAVPVGVLFLVVLLAVLGRRWPDPALPAEEQDEYEYEPVYAYAAQPSYPAQPSYAAPPQPQPSYAAPQPSHAPPPQPQSYGQGGAWNQPRPALPQGSGWNAPRAESYERQASPWAPPPAATPGHATRRDGTPSQAQGGRHGGGVRDNEPGEWDDKARHGRHAGGNNGSWPGNATRQRAADEPTRPYRQAPFRLPPDDEGY